MKRNKKDDNLLLKFKLSYSSIFFNIKFTKMLKNHFDKNGGFAAFTLAFLENQMGFKKLSQHIKLNKDEWLDLFFDVYDSKEINDVFSSLKLNPIIDLENIIKSFDCFDVIIDKIIQYIETEQFNICVESSQMKQILKNGFGYILYNCIECMIQYSFEEILSDPKYDEKVMIILNNTKLFARVKQSILNYCGYKVNNLISLLLGISRNLNKDKKLIK